MRLSSCRCTDALMEDFFVFDMSLEEIQPDEQVPLLSHSSVPVFCQNSEMAPVHNFKRHIHISDTLKVPICGMSPLLKVDASLSYLKAPNKGIFFLVDLFNFKTSLLIFLL